MRNMNVDEAYVRDRICMDIGAQEHPDAQTLFQEKVVSSILRPESDREREELVRSMEPASAPVDVNKYLAGVWSFRFAMKRFSRVMRKIVRGLYAYHMGKRIPADYGFETVRLMDLEMVQRAQNWMSGNNPSPSFSVGERMAGWYRYAASKPNPLGNNWLLVFYLRFGFYVYAGPQGRDGRVQATDFRTKDASAV